MRSFEKIQTPPLTGENSMNDNRAEADAGKLEWSAPQIDIVAATAAENGSNAGSDSNLVS
jgi:hypothetical protein